MENNISVEVYWNILLEIKDRLKANKEIRFFSIIENEDKYIISEKLEDTASVFIDFRESEIQVESALYFDCSKPLNVTKKINGAMNNNLNEIADLFNTYLPYAVLPYFSNKEKKAFVISHFAQTLDGRIASSSGDSKWIGNEENLYHAHRMRALCDAILVGSKTVTIDDPRLNVRLVEGNNPKKIIIGGKPESLSTCDALLNDTFFFNEADFPVNHGCQLFNIQKANGNYEMSEILDVLYSEGISSIYLEGGSYTASSFLLQSCIDQVQIHYSPKILGSGSVGFTFDGIETMEKAINFKTFEYLPIGKEVMFIGNL